MSSNSRTIVKIGLIGCGEIAQVSHIPILIFMRDWFRITYLCDVSSAALEHCSKGLATEHKTTKDPQELCSSDQVDAVLIANSDEYHAAHAILALQNNKHVLVEKPLALTRRDVHAIIEAEKSSKGKVMVGYMRRYAAAFEEAVKHVGGLDKILYARVRDFICPNSCWVAQSGTFPKRFTDFEPQDSADKQARADEMIKTALEEECEGVKVTPDTTRMWRIFSGLGSHDLSAMREILGMPEKVVGSSLTFPFWNVLFKYPDFTVAYESGVDNVPRFDAHVEIFGSEKTVRVQYDTPYIRGLPVTLHISENVDGAFSQSVIRKTYEDPYTLEFKKLWEMVVEGKSQKTTAEDALKDLDLFKMAMEHYHKA